MIEATARHRHRVFTVIAAILTFLSAQPSSARPVSQRKDLSLIFNLDQAMQNGMIENYDTKGLETALRTIELFNKKYRSFVLFSPLTAKTQNLKDFLKITAKHKIPFFLDVYSSDAMAIGNILTPARADADPTEARTISLESLRRIKSDRVIGPFFAGIRFHEIGALDFTVKACRQKSLGPDRITWCDHFDRNINNVDIMNVERIKPFLDFARNTGMIAIWADWKWDAGTAEQQMKLNQVIQSGQYRKSLILQYANNLPDEAARDHDLDWRNWLMRHHLAIDKTILGLGLSDQSWTCRSQKDCPPAVITQWVDRAMTAKVSVIEFEPSFYFFQLPVDDKPIGYPDGPRWRNAAGLPTPALRSVAKTLGVALK